MSEVKLTMVRDGGCLRPYGQVAWEEFDHVRTTKPVVVSIKQARNPEHLNKYWAVASAVARFDSDFEDKDDADFWVRSHMPSMRKEYVLSDGRVGIRVKSIAVESMDQLHFNRFYDRALWLWSQKIGCDPESLLKEAAA